MGMVRVGKGVVDGRERTWRGGAGGGGRLV